MPMPNLLPEIDWRAVFDGAWDYAAWRSEGQVRVDADFLGTYPADKHDQVRAFLAANRSRMDETDASFALDVDVTSRLAALERTVHVVGIAEDWCPDVVRHVPVFQKLVDASDKVSARYIMRADRLDVFAQHLTAGGEAVPKLVFLNEEFVECSSWGPMPAACRELIERGRASGDLKTARQKVSALYEADADRRVVVEELLHNLEIAACTTP